jgi:hypothetical protein
VKVMRDISLHVLDIVMNSLSAGATLVEISLSEWVSKNSLELVISDNGTGMDDETIKRVLDPFYTTRKTRKVGLGLSLLAQNAFLSNGTISIQSKRQQGTTVFVTFGYDHLDRIPIGDMTETIISLILLEPDKDFVYRYSTESKQYVLDTREIKEYLQEVPIHNKAVIKWIKEDLNQAI